MLITFADFCAGIGAGRLGLEKNGLKCVSFFEINKSAIKTYNILHNIKSEINYGDLTKVDCSKIPQFELMIAGFPCQSFSVLGKRKGFNDERGQIIYSLIKILKERKTPYFILENVKGLINHDNGKTIKTIEQSLINAGYYVTYKALNSLNYGVPQMRERVYFVGIKKELLKKNKDFIWPDQIKTPDIKKYLIDENNEINEKRFKTFKKYLNNKYNKGKFKLEQLLSKEYSVLDTRQSDLRIYFDKIPTLRAGRRGILYVRNGVLRNLTGYESLLLQGFDKHYADKIKNKVIETQLLAQAGNAMTVTAITAICKSLLNYIGE